MTLTISQRRSSRLPLVVFGVAAILSGLFYLIAASSLFQRLAAHQNRIDFSKGALAPTAIVHDFYFLGLILVLPLIYVCRFIVATIESRIENRPWVHYAVSGFWISAITALLYLSHFIFLLRESAAQFYTPLGFLALALSLVCCLADLPKWARLALYIVTGALFCLAAYHIIESEFLPFRTRDLSGIDGPWTAMNFNTVFYSVVQAAKGRLDLIDYYAQYGNYSAFLRPFFAVIPLSVTSYSAVMTFLTMLVYVFIFLGLRQLGIRTAIIAVALLSCYFLTSQNLLFQYWAILPVRMIFPALIFFLATKFNHGGNRWLYYATMIACAVAALWNIDTGLVALIAWLLTLSYEHVQLLPLWQGAKKILKDGALALAMIALLLCLYALYTYVVRGELPHYKNLLLYQTMYFGQSRGAVPFGLFDGWSLVILIYIAGLAHVLTGRHENGEPRTNSTILFLSLFGLGNFSYYIMRSVPANIFLVMWPAVIILAAFAESLIRQRRFATAIAATLPIAYWAVVTTGVLLTNHAAPANEDDYNARLDTQRAWVQSLHLKQKDIIILSDNSAIFYLDSQANCPLQIPGISETISAPFVTMIEDYVNTKPGLIILDSSKIWYPEPSLGALQSLVKALPVAAKSPDGTLMLYTTGPHPGP